MRGPHRQERIPLFTALLTPGLTDANLFTQKLIQMCKDNPDLTKGLRAVAYDMALRSADSDRLMDHGILPITKTPVPAEAKPQQSTSDPTPSKPPPARPKQTSSRSMAPPTSPSWTEKATPATSPSAGSLPKSKKPDPEPANTSSKQLKQVGQLHSVPSLLAKRGV